jgi:hypothetical protein
VNALARAVLRTRNVIKGKGALGLLPRFAALWVCASAMIVPVAALSSSTTGIDRFEIVNRISPAFAGESFGTTGQYEVLICRAHGLLDPRQANDRAIVGLDKAPRNKDGLVEYAMDVAIARPIDLNKSSGKIVYEVINRGHGSVDLEGVKPQWDARFFLERGAVLVDSAWQGELAPRPGMLSASFPVAGSRFRPVVQRIRQEFIFDGSPITAPIGAAGPQALVHPAANTDKRRAQLYVRRLEADPWTLLTPEHFEFVDRRTITIREATGFDHGAIYDFVYDATDPIVAGVSLASVRDLMSYLKYRPSGSGHPLEDGPAPTEAYAFGLSQSGRFLKVFLWQGFNRDAAGRRVFDGLMPIVSGGRKGDFNRLFAQPGMSSNQHSGRRFPDNSFPFTYAVTMDPKSGKRDGLLRECEATQSCPKIIHLDSDNEMAAAFGWMVTTDLAGKPVELPPNVRAYFAAGLQHGTPLRMPGCRGDPVEVSYTPLQHALFAALDDWVSKEVAPPPSRYPTLADGSLVSISSAASMWPKIPGRPYSAVRNVPEDWDYRKILPTSRHSYGVLTPRLDQDGNEMDGVLLPEVAVPTGTSSGHTDVMHGYALGDQCALQGEFIPFAATKAERMASGDPRRSVEERYPESQPSVDRRRQTITETLVAERLLPESSAGVRPSSAAER